jgi:hypothetical protein
VNRNREKRPDDDKHNGKNPSTGNDPLIGLRKHLRILILLDSQTRPDVLNELDVCTSREKHGATDY